MKTSFFQLQTVFTIKIIPKKHAVSSKFDAEVLGKKFFCSFVFFFFFVFFFLFCFFVFFLFFFVVVVFFCPDV